MRTLDSLGSSVCGLHAATASSKSMSWAKIGSARDAGWVTGMMPRQLNLLLKRRRSGRRLMPNRPMRGIPLGTRQPVRSRSCGARTVSRAASWRRRLAQRRRQRRERWQHKEWRRRADGNKEKGSWRSLQRQMIPGQRQATQTSLRRLTLGAKRSSTSVPHQRNGGDCPTTGC